jgi:hypothetical protein
MDQPDPREVKVIDTASLPADGSAVGTRPDDPYAGFEESLSSH